MSRDIKREEKEDVEEKVTGFLRDLQHTLLLTELYDMVGNPAKIYLDSEDSRLWKRVIRFDRPPLGVIERRRLKSRIFREAGASHIFLRSYQDHRKTKFDVAFELDPEYPGYYGEFSLGTQLHLLYPILSTNTIFDEWIEGLDPSLRDKIFQYALNEMKRFTDRIPETIKELNRESAYSLYRYVSILGVDEAFREIFIKI